MSYIKRIKRNGIVYLSEVESKRVDGKVVQRHIRYLGKEEQNAERTTFVSIAKAKIKKHTLALKESKAELKLALKKEDVIRKKSKQKKATKKVTKKK